MTISWILRFGKVPLIFLEVSKMLRRFMQSMRFSRIFENLKSFEGFL